MFTYHIPTINRSFYTLAEAHNFIKYSFLRDDFNATRLRGLCSFFRVIMRTNHNTGTQIELKYPLHYHSLTPRGYDF